MNQPWLEPAQPLNEKTGIPVVLFFLLCISLVGGFGTWAWYGKLDIVAVASGEITPSSQTQSVQHLEGGIVSEIKIEEGAEVKTGQSLIVLESVRSGADRDEIEIRVGSLKVDIARLEAEALGKKGPVFTNDLIKAHPDMVISARTLFETKKRRFFAEIGRQKEQIIQRAQEIKEIQARLKNTRYSLKLITDQVKLSEDLLRENLTVEFDHLKLLRDQSNLKSQIDQDAAALPRVRAGLKEAKLGIEQITQAYRAEAREELKEAIRTKEELEQRLKKFEDNFLRSVLRAPMDGIIQTIHVKTIGGVVRAGDTVVDIVPLDDRLIIEAQLPVQDIGYVSLGQEAFIKLNSPELARFGKLDGQVTHISPDKLVRDDGLPYFRIRIETDKDYFEFGEQKYRLFPGTQVIASIRTGERTVLEYLLDPFIGSIGDALRER